MQKLPNVLSQSVPSKWPVILQESTVLAPTLIELQSFLVDKSESYSAYQTWRTQQNFPPELELKSFIQTLEMAEAEWQNPLSELPKQSLQLLIHNLQGVEHLAYLLEYLSLCCINETLQTSISVQHINYLLVILAKCNLTGKASATQKTITSLEILIEYFAISAINELNTSQLIKIVSNFLNQATPHANVLSKLISSFHACSAYLSTTLDIRFVLLRESLNKLNSQCLIEKKGDQSQSLPRAISKTLICVAEFTRKYALYPQIDQQIDFKLIDKLLSHLLELEFSDERDSCKHFVYVLRAAVILGQSSATKHSRELAQRAINYFEKDKYKLERKEYDYVYESLINQFTLYDYITGEHDKPAAAIIQKALKLRRPPPPSEGSLIDQILRLKKIEKFIIVEREAERNLGPYFGDVFLKIKISQDQYLHVLVEVNGACHMSSLEKDFFRTCVLKWKQEVQVVVNIDLWDNEYYNIDNAVAEIYEAIVVYEKTQIKGKKQQKIPQKFSLCDYINQELTENTEAPVVVIAKPTDALLVSPRTSAAIISTITETLTSTGIPLATVTPKEIKIVVSKTSETIPIKSKTAPKPVGIKKMADSNTIFRFDPLHDKKHLSKTAVEDKKIDNNAMFEKLDDKKQIFNKTNTLKTTVHNTNKNRQTLYLQSKIATKLIRELALENNASAQFSLGFFYETGSNGFKKDQQEAITWYEKAALQDYVRAQNSLAIIYLYGEGVEKDEKKAVHWFSLAAKQEDPKAQTYLTMCYLNGQGVTQDKEEAFRLANLAAAKGYVTGQALLGICFLQGYGVTKDQKEGIRLLQLAAQQGSPEAQVNLGVCYEDGMGMKKNEKKAIHYYRMAAEQNEANGLVYLGLYYIQKQSAEDKRKGVEYFHSAAKQENIQAQTCLGSCYSMGMGVKKDKQQAFYWYRLAAAQGSARAQDVLGYYYLKGMGVAKDDAQGIYWYRLAAKQGYAEGEHHLGQCYLLGEGVDKDEKQAVYWFRLAVAKQNASAQTSLGICYKKGWGVAQHLEEAIRWFKLAVSQKCAEAQYQLGLCHLHGMGILQDKKQALALFHLGALQGNAAAQNQLGLCFLQGEGVTQNKKQAFHWFNLAALQGFSAAQYHLAMCYDPKTGIKRNAKLMIYWLTLAAKQGDDLAQYALGSCYYLGEDGVNIDYTQAVHWFRLSAAQKNSAAQNNLGICYMLGKGVKQNSKTAFINFHLSATQDYVDAKYNLSKCYKEGNGVNKDLTEYARLLSWAAQHNHLVAQQEIAQLQSLAKLLLPQNKTLSYP